jgi:fatty acid desaturase
MQWTEIPRYPPLRMLRQFGALLAVVSLSMAAWRGSHGGDWRALAAVAVMAAAVTLVRPEALRLVFVGWLMLAFPIGWVVGRVALAIIFFGVFMPVGMVLRLIGRDPLRRQRAEGTYWTRRPRAKSADYFRQY